MLAVCIVLALAYCPNYDTPRWCIAEACRWHDGECKDDSTRADTVEVVVSSKTVDQTTVTRALTSMVGCPAFQHGVNVYGFNPMIGTPGIAAHAVPASPMHNAYRWLATERRALVPTKNHKTALVESVTRASRRTQFNLDAWHVLADAYTSRTADIVVWLESDRNISCTRMRRALARFRTSPASGAACGTACMMFKRTKLPDFLRHVLEFHMVKPFDLILRDYGL